MEKLLEIPQRKKRTFVAEDFVASTWAAIEPYYNNLEKRELNSVSDLQQWLKDWSELDAVLEENARWIYVRSTTDTSDEKAKADLTNLYTTIYPNTSPRENVLKKKFIASPFIEELDKEVFFTTIRKIKKEAELFREENVALQSELNMKQSEFDRIAGAQSITYNGSELTLQQASIFLKSTNREQRKEVFEAMAERRWQDAEKLDTLLTELIQLRHKIALNAGYENYVAYRFDELGRFDYTQEDCFTFHESVAEVIMPLINELSEERKAKLGLDTLKPYDFEVDTSGKAPLKPCQSTDELIEKTIACFNQLDSYFGERITIMKEMNYLDLDSRMHKGPGGYNMTMPEIGVPFIFMNAANSESDLVTMVHEGGHAVHTFLSHPLDLNVFKQVTSEVAEVASMGMELMSMEHWDVFYPNAEDNNRARKNHLQHILSILAKTCMGDRFQFWLYLNPNHTVEERRSKWAELNRMYSPSNIDWSGYDDILKTGYQRILHFYVVPFYYIEYALAQLGALAIWKNFKQQPDKTIEQYKQALSLGYTKPIPVFYETAGAKFKFDKEYVSYLTDFVKKELTKL